MVKQGYFFVVERDVLKPAVPWSGPYESAEFAISLLLEEYNAGENIFIVGPVPYIQVIEDGKRV